MSSAPYCRICMRLATGAFAGRNTLMRRPAAAPTAAMLDAALPVDARTISSTPCFLAKLATRNDALSLKEPEGLQVSSLLHSVGALNWDDTCNPSGSFKDRAS